MSDINLLPEELKKREAEERKRQEKKSRIVEVKLTTPSGETPATGRGFWKKLGEQGTEGRATAPRPLFSGKSDERSGIARSPDFIKKESISNGDISKERLMKAHGVLEENDVEMKKAEEPGTRGEAVDVEGAAVKPRIVLERVEEKAAVGVRRFISLSWWRENIGGIVERFRGNGNGDVAVNLMPEDLTTIKDVEWVKIGSVLGGSILISLAIITISYFVLLGRLRAEQQEFTNLQDTIRSLGNEIEELTPQKEQAFAVHRKIETVHELLKNHVYWTRFLSLLEANTLDDVSFSGLTGNVRQDITLTGIAKDISTLLSQREVLNDAKHFVSGVEMSNVQTTDEGVLFTMVLHVLPEVWGGAT